MNQQQQIHYWAHMLDEAFCKDQLLTEGKHWPEDYIKTAYNTIKSSPLGQQSWYTDEYLTRDLIGPPIDPNSTKQEPVHDINRIDKSDLAHNASKYGILGDFSPLMHKNSNLGFFSTIVRWFIEYAGTSQQKYQEFIERKLDGIIGTLQVILNDPSYDKIKDEIKQKWTFAQFEELQKKIADEAKTSSDEKLKGLVKRDDYDLIPIYSYEELHEKFGGSWTGYRGESEWCHTNGKSTYESWTKDGTQMFFVLAKKDWQKVFQPEYKPTGKDYNAYDEYGLSLIAILVDVATDNLLNETLRWNHVIDPSYTNPGASVDKAFKNSWGALSQAVGMDVKATCEKYCKDLKQKLQKEADAANEQIEEILRGKTEINSNTIPKAIKSHLTKVVIPNTVTSIWHQAFSECSKLTSVTIPDSVTSIGSDAFSNCSRLTSVTIPNSITNIGSYVFSGCSELMNITIPDSVTIIENSAFRGCSRLTSVTIPDSVTSIGIYAFCDCSNLTSVTIPDSMMSIPAAAFHNCHRLINMTIPDSVTSIGRWAFANCSSLTGVVIPDNVTNIGNSAFFNCSGLTRVMIPDSVTTIESSAFSSCRGLTYVMIPDSVTSIGNWAFDHCDNLKSLVFKGKTLEEVKAMEKYPFGIKDESIIKCEA